MTLLLQFLRDLRLRAGESDLLPPPPSAHAAVRAPLQPETDSRTHSPYVTDTPAAQSAPDASHRSRASTAAR